MRLVNRTLIMAVLLLTSSVALADPEWSGRNRIETMLILDGTNIVRLEITNSITNPAGCTNTTYLDYQLDSDDRSETQQKLLLDALTVALIMSQPIEFLIDDVNCSTVETSGSVRIAVGLQLHRT